MYAVRLEWSPPLDNGGTPHSLTRYEIFVDNILEVTTNATFTTIERSSMGEQLVELRAVNCAGYSDNASIVINFNAGIPIHKMYDMYALHG